MPSWIEFMKTKEDLLAISMTIKKPNRTEWESTQKEKIAFLKRKQEEKETKRSLKDFLKHLKEDDKDASTN